MVGIAVGARTVVVVGGGGRVVGFELSVRCGDSFAGLELHVASYRC